MHTDPTPPRTVRLTTSLKPATDADLTTQKNWTPRSTAFRPQLTSQQLGIRAEADTVATTRDGGRRGSRA